MANPYDRFDRPASPAGQPTLRERKTLADLEGEYARRDAERQRLDLERRRVARMEATPLPEAPKPAVQRTREVMMETRGKVIGEKAAAQEFSLPKIEQSVGRAFQSAQELLAHPGFEAATGMPNPFKGGFGVGEVPGTPAGDYTTALRGAAAEAFVPAFEALKGAGAITEKEGQAAQAALANLGTGMSEAQFKRELQKYVDKLGAGLEIARKQAGMGGSPFTYDDLMREKRRREAMKGQR
jgi:hypothetical protein